MFAYHQLIKQGIDKKNITIHFIQYGDEESDMINSVKTKGKQASVVLDFAAFPRKNLYDEIKILTNYKFKDYTLESKFYNYIKKAIRGNIENKKGFIDFTRKTFELPEDKDLETFYTLFRQLKASSIGDKFNKDDYSVTLADPDFLSDHHYDDKGKLVKGKSGSIKSSFRSDAEHIAVSFAPGVADYTTIQQVSNMDSAKFSRLEDNFELPKDFKKSGRMERLAILSKAFIEDALKSDTETAKEILKASSPSLVSVYSQFIKHYKFNAVKAKLYQELTKEKPNWTLIDELRKQLPSSMREKTSKEDLSKTRKLKSRKEWIEFAERNLAKAKQPALYPEKEKEIEDKYAYDLETNALHVRTLKNIIKNEEDKISKAKTPEEKKKLEDSKKDSEEKLKEYEEKLKKAEKEKEKELGKYTGSFRPRGNIMVQNDNTKSSFSRYLASALNVRGQRKPFSIRRFNSMIQIAMNPDAPEELKKEVDLAAVAKKVLEETRKKYETFSNKWAFELIKESSGGHKGITTFSKLNLLGLMPKKNRDRLKELEALSKRARAAKTSLKDIEEKTGKGDKSKWSELQHLWDERDRTAQIRKEIMDYMIDLIEKELSVYRKYKVEKQQTNPEKYKMNEENLSSITKEII